MFGLQLNWLTMRPSFENLCSSSDEIMETEAPVSNKKLMESPPAGRRSAVGGRDSLMNAREEETG